MLDHLEQIKFFDRVREAMPPQYNLAGELAEILQTSIDSAYRRIRGETALSYSELLHIQQKFNLKQSVLFPTDNIEEVNFEFARPTYGYDTFLFLKNIANQMNLVHRRNNLSVALASDDLPFFLHFLSPVLIQFKLLVFSGKEIHQQSQNSNEHDPALEEVIELIIKRWIEANSLEIWGTRPLDSTLRQIEYYYANDMINRDYAALLLSELNLLVERVNMWATNGRKEFNGLSGGEFRLFQSELNLGEMTLNIAFGAEVSTYKSNYGYGYLKTEHPRFCQETTEWINDVANKAILISGSAERFRTRYINEMKMHIQQTADRMRII